MKTPNNKLLKIIVLISVLLPLLLLIVQVYDKQAQIVLKVIPIQIQQNDLYSQTVQAIELLQSFIQSQKIKIQLFLPKKDTMQLQTQGQFPSQNSAQSIIARKIKSLLKQYQHLNKINLKYFQLQLKQKDSSHSDQNYYITKCKESMNLIEEIQSFWEQTILQKAQKIIFTVVLFNINSNQNPLTVDQVGLLQQKFYEYLGQNTSFLNHILSKQNNSSQYLFPQIEIVFKSSYISQIDQNFHFKMQEIFKQQQNNWKTINNKANQVNQHQKTKINEFYLQQIFDEIQKINKNTECRYVKSYTKCKDFSIFVAYQNEKNFFQQFQQIRFDDQSMNGSDKTFSSIKNQISYFSRQDKSTSLISLHSSINVQNQFLFLYQALQQVIFENLHLSQIILLSQTHHSKQIKALDEIQLRKEYLTKFIKLTQLQKLKNNLQTITNIVNAEQVIYERLDSSVETKILEKIREIRRKLKEGVFISSNTINTSDLNEIRKLDTFPSEYKLGALIPISIILLYPCLGLFKFLFR